MANRTNTVARDPYYDNTQLPPRKPRVYTKRRKPREITPEIRIVGSVDYVMLFVVLILVAFGIVMVFSASNLMASNRFNDPLHFVRQNIIFAGMGGVTMWLLSTLNYELLRPFVPIMYAVAVVLLIAVIAIGETAGGATRWIVLPVIGNFQPSELARAVIIFTMAYAIERNPTLPKTWKGLGMLAAIIGFIVALIALPGGFTVALVTAGIGFGMVAVSSPHFGKFVAMGVAAGSAIGGYLYWQYITGGGFRGSRFGVWLDPFSDPQGRGFQTIQSLYAIATGGWLGLGVGGSQQASFVPEPHNDIIFAIIIEETGFLGACVVLFLFGVFIWRGIIVSMRAPDTFSSLIALGIVFAIGFQAAINIGVVTNTIPNTGVNLPFISYGGTSLLVTMAMVGVLLNISRFSVQKKNKAS